MLALGPACRKRDRCFEDTMFWSIEWAGIKASCCNFEGQVPAIHKATFKALKRLKWSSIYIVLQQSTQAWKCVFVTKEAEIDTMLPNSAGKKNLRSIPTQLSNLDEATDHSQRVRTTLRATRTYFDPVLDTLFRLCKRWEGDIHQKPYLLLE